MFTLQENWAIYFSAFIVIFFCFKSSARILIPVFYAWFDRTCRFYYFILDCLDIMWCICKIRYIVPSKFLGLAGSPLEEVAKTYVNQIAWFILLFLVLRILFFVVDRIAKGRT